MDIGLCVHVMRQVADAVRLIHSKNIIHRDIKPDNIMLVEKDGNSHFVKLLDFGLAKAEYHTRVTQSGIFVGTLHYVAPEQFTGQSDSRASDVYSLGILFYEVMTGQKAFKGETSTRIMKKVMDFEPAHPQLIRSDIPDELNRLIMRMISKDPDSRPTIKTVLDTLNKLGNVNVPGAKLITFSTHQTDLNPDSS